MLELRVETITENAKLPQRAHKFDAGFDLFCDTDFIIPPSNETILVTTGLKLAIPRGYYGRIVGRSGLTSRTPLRVLEGIIDADYRGELKIMVTSNVPQCDESIEAGSKIAQLIIQPLPNIALVTGKPLDETTRGEGGFGSTDHQENA